MIEHFCQWLAATAISQALARLEWFVPLVQSIHILALAAVFTALAMIDLRVMRGRVAAADGPALAARLAPQLKVGLWVMLASGLLLTLIEPARELMNTAFRLKMLLLPLLVLSAALTLRRLRSQQPLSAAVAAANLLIVLTMVCLGRFIAYL